MLRIESLRNFAIQCVAGTDRVMFGVTLPSDTVVHGVSMKSTFLGATEAAASAAVFGIAFESWVLPLLDPDAGLAYDTLWDNLVPKDSSSDVLDLDTGGIDTGNFWEPGQADWGAVFDVGLRPQRLFHERSLITLANGALIVWQDNQTPFVLKFWPGGQLNWRFRRSFRVRQPSALLFGVSSPSMDDKTTTQTVLSEAQIPQVKYMRSVLERALMNVLGLVEAGAETPWEEASVLIKEHVDPNFFEASGLGTLATTAWNVQGEARINHSVVGDLKVGRLTTGR